MALYISEAVKRRVRFFSREREPRKVRGGAARGAEHGLGAEPSSGDSPQVDGSGSPRYRRLRYGQNARANQGGTASVFVALG